MKKNDKPDVAFNVRIVDRFKAPTKLRIADRYSTRMKESSIFMNVKLKPVKFLRHVERGIKT